VGSAIWPGANGGLGHGGLSANFFMYFGVTYLYSLQSLAHILSIFWMRTLHWFLSSSGGVQYPAYISSGISNAVLTSALFPPFCGFLPSAVFFSWGIWKIGFSEEVCNFSSRNAANELSWCEPSDLAADMSTCEHSIVARNLERSYAFSEGFIKEQVWGIWPDESWRISLSVLCLRFQRCIDKKIHTFEESWRKT